MKNDKSLPVRPVFLGPVLFLLLGLSLAQAQTGSAQAGADIQEQLIPSDTRQLPMVSGTAGPALESIVNPDVYYVGPYDVLSINVWVTPPMAYSLPVTPEGTIILPTVGEIRVADRSLRDVKRTIAEEIRSRYRKGEITVRQAGTFNLFPDPA